MNADREHKINQVLGAKSDRPDELDGPFAELARFQQHQVIKTHDEKGRLCAIQDTPAPGITFVYNKNEVLIDIVW